MVSSNLVSVQSVQVIALLLLTILVPAMSAESSNPPRPLPCANKKQCVHELGVHSDCSKQRICICANSSTYRENDGNIACFKNQTEVNEPCETEEECQIESTKCVKHVCQCHEGLVSSLTKTKCLSVVDKLGGHCEEDVQCSQAKLGAGVSCPTNKCECRFNSVLLDEMCFIRSGLNEKCTDHRNCQHIKGAGCEEDICTCARNFVPSSVNSSICLEVAKDWGDACEQGNQCSEILGDNYVCVESKCDCMYKFTYQPTSKLCVDEEEIAENVIAGEALEPAVGTTQSNDVDVATDSDVPSSNGRTTPVARVSEDQSRNSDANRDSGNQPAASSDSENQPAASSDNGNQPAASSDSGNQPAASSDSEDQPRHDMAAHHPGHNAACGVSKNYRVLYALISAHVCLRYFAIS